MDKLKLVKDLQDRVEHLEAHNQRVITSLVAAIDHLENLELAVAETIKGIEDIRRVCKAVSVKAQSLSLDELGLREPTRGALKAAGIDSADKLHRAVETGEIARVEGITEDDIEYSIRYALDRATVYDNFAGLHRYLPEDKYVKIINTLRRSKFIEDIYDLRKWINTPDRPKIRSLGDIGIDMIKDALAMMDDTSAE